MSILTETPRQMERTDAVVGPLNKIRAARQQRAAVISLPRDNAPTWPDAIDPAAFHGLAGDVVHMIEPHTEADPVALLVQFLAATGNCIGRRAYFAVESDKHYPNLYGVIVGETSKARKGTSWGRIRTVFELVDDSWTRMCIHSGLSSGEGLIWAVRDPIYGRERTGKGSDARTMEMEQDPGVTDKRLFVIESEFANVLRVITRQGNTLSRVIRDGWDRGDLATMTKNSPARATGAHISIVGHITADELRRYLDRTEAASGFANRFLYVCVRRSRCLPHGGVLDEPAMKSLAERLALAIGDAQNLGEVKMDAEASAAWERVYPDLSEGQPGLLGAILGRAEAQVVRLALVYALLDGNTQIRLPHLKAALALWSYSETSARYVFGATLGDPVADEIVRALAQVGDQGLTRTEISRALGNHRSGVQLGRALDLLVQLNRAHCKTVETNGRPAEVWYAGGVP